MDFFEHPPIPCLGAGGFGTSIDTDRAFELLDRYAAAGGRLVDTAHVYAAWVEGGAGASEKTIGAWLAETGGQGLAVGTKGGHPPLDVMGPGHLGEGTLRRHLRESLDRLGLDRVDLYWLHRDEPARPVGEIVETLHAFIEEGRIGAWGVSNWTVARTEAAIAFARERQRIGPCASQPGWSLAETAPDSLEAHGMRPMLESDRRWHAQGRLPAVPFASQAHGWFGGDNARWAADGFEGEPPRAAEYDLPVNRRRLLRAIELGKEKGATANQIALAYLMGQSFPVWPVIGTSKPERVDEAFGARRILLSGDELESLRRPQGA